MSRCVAVGLVGILLCAAAAPVLAQPSPASGAAAAKITIPSGQIFGLFGNGVQDADGLDAGRLWDVLIDKSGAPQAAVIDYGGTLGVGRRKVAVAWTMLQFGTGDTSRPIRVRFSRKELGTIPDFKYDGSPMVVGTDH